MVGNIACISWGMLMVLDRTQPDEQKLMKKGRGRLIHVSDFVEEDNGRLIVRDADGRIVKDARCITYPGTHGDAWWDHTQLLAQVNKAISIFEEAHPGCVALFVFDHSSAHASLAPDALRAFDMNKSNGGKQRKQRDTVIPMNNPCIQYRGKLQKMTTESGEAKGLQQTLEERGFTIDKKMKTKCSPVCTIENEGCCMARLLSKQDDFWLQKSQVEEMITERGHLCIFLPKFHCELNPIEMVCFYFILLHLFLNLYSTGVGANTGTGNITRKHFQMQRGSHATALMHAQLKSSDVSSIDLGGSCWHIKKGSLGRQLNGLCANRNLIGVLESGQCSQLRKMSLQIDPKGVLII